jgi:hypothetical protein
MTRIQVTFFADLPVEEMEDIDSADPALLYQWLPELVEKVVNTSEVGIYHLSVEAVE